VAAALLEQSLGQIPCRRGKVRDVYDLGDRLLIVATDRISAFDWVLPNGIPEKGVMLTGLCAFWFDWLAVPHHVLSWDIADAGLDLPADRAFEVEARSMVVRKARVIPFECVVRGYLAGSAWREYRATGTVCGERLPAGLVESDRLDPPLFTPATKAETGHDENVSFAEFARAVAQAEELRARSLEIYEDAAAFALSKGLILADTKLEWGIDRGRGEGDPILIDEVLTPDSSRYWPAEDYRPGGPQPSFDKQFVRDWLETTGWDKNSQPPLLPEDVVKRTRDKYLDAYERLTGARLAAS
jgi:phosphoribosylaminoimidazole-succinocarboxamide synthase